MALRVHLYLSQFSKRDDRLDAVARSSHFLCRTVANGSVDPSTCAVLSEISHINFK